MSAAAPTVAHAGSRRRAVIAVPSATGVDARVVLAGPGARSIAFVIDWLIRSGLALVYLLLAALLHPRQPRLSRSIPTTRRCGILAGAMPATAIYFLYHLILEPLMAGRTPGKRMTGRARTHARRAGADHGRAGHAQRVPHHRLACRCSTSWACCS